MLSLELDTSTSLQERKRLRLVWHHPFLLARKKLKDSGVESRGSCSRLVALADLGESLAATTSGSASATVGSEAARSSKVAFRTASQPSSPPCRWAFSRDHFRAAMYV